MTDKSPILVTYGMIAFAGVVVAGLAALFYTNKPDGQLERTPQAAEAPAQPPATAQPALAPQGSNAKPTLAADGTPIAFRDGENTQRYLSLLDATAAFRKRLAELDVATTMPTDDLSATCREIAALANPLAGEPHPAVRKYADDAKRACDYDRPLATIALTLRLLKAPGADKKALCRAGSRATDALAEKKYGDDERVKLAFAALGKACL